MNLKLKYIIHSAHTHTITHSRARSHTEICTDNFIDIHAVNKEKKLFGITKFYMLKILVVNDVRQVCACG